MRGKQHQQTSNTHTFTLQWLLPSSFNQLRSARWPSSQSGYGTRDPIPGKRQAHTYRSRGRALCRTCEHTWHVDHQRGDLYHA
jgi:hypothetical protein